MNILNKPAALFVECYGFIDIHRENMIKTRFIKLTRRDCIVGVVGIVSIVNVRAV